MHSPTMFRCCYRSPCWNLRNTSTPTPRSSKSLGPLTKCISFLKFLRACSVLVAPSPSSSPNKKGHQLSPMTLKTKFQRSTLKSLVSLWSEDPATHHCSCLTASRNAYVPVPVVHPVYEVE